MTAATAAAPHESLVEAAASVLTQPDPWLKAQLTQEIVKAWRAGAIERVQPPGGTAHIVVPDRPSRADDRVKVVPPGQVPRLKQGGTLASRQAIVHSLCHIESWAVDLAWDIIVRFGCDPQWAPYLPRSFYDDFVAVADDECRHFLLLEARLQGLDSHYGALPAHDGLWESASRTAHSCAARLAVEHAVHEARGLDVLPNTIAKFKNAGDSETAALLEGVILPEEVYHCAAGVRWLRHLHEVASTSGSTSSSSSGESTQPAWMHEARQHGTPQEWFHALVRQHFHGNLKPPFNEWAREQAGFTPDWYLPLVKSSTEAANGANLEPT